jgi:hypothetical protein
MSALLAVEDQSDDWFVENTGKAYQDQPTKLIGLCRLFSRVAKQQQLPHAELSK